jgi:hypothetical protein
MYFCEQKQQLQMMKKLISSIALLLCAIMAQAADITEDFSTLAKGKYGARLSSHAPPCIGAC